MPSPRVLVLTTTYPRWQGDTEPAFVHYLNKELVSHGAEVYTLAPHCKGALATENLDGVNVRRFRYLPQCFEKLAYDGGIMPKLKQSPWLIWQMPFLFLSMFFTALFFVYKYKITHIHAHWVVPQGVIAVAIKILSFHRVKVVVTSHGADLFSLKGGVFKKLKAWVFKRADTVTVVSEDMKSYCEKVLNLTREINVLSMGIDTNTFIDKTDFQKRQGFLFVGRLVEKKGVSDLLRAFQKFLTINNNEILTIVGGGLEERSLVSLVKELKIETNVFFVGSHPIGAVAKYFNQAKFFVMPSKVAADGDQEGLGLVAAESLASGCISLVSDLPAINDVHTEPFLKFTAGDVDSLLECMLRCYEHQDKAKALAEQQKLQVIEKFSWNKVGENYYRLFQ